MPIHSAITLLNAPAAAAALAEALEEVDPAPYAVGTMEIEDGQGRIEVAAHFEEAPDEVELALLAAAFGARPFVVSEVPDQDWVTKVRRDLPPVEAGRFFLYGQHDADKLPEGRVGLLIEATVAFGTGHHGTTLGCLRALDRLLTEGLAPGRVADIGCGTGVLALAAAKVWPGTVMAGDNDPVAVEVARANAAANGLDGRLSCHLSEGFDAEPLAAGAPYDLIFANILKGPIVALAPAMARNAAPGARVILSGLLTEQAGDVLSVYLPLGFNLADRTVIGDWATLVLVRDPARKGKLAPAP